MDMDMIKTIKAREKAFKNTNGGSITEEERLKINRQAERDYWISFLRDRGEIAEDATEEEINGILELKRKQFNLKAIRVREEDHKLLHGIEDDRANQSYEAFMKTVPERYKSASLSDFNPSATIVNHILEGGSCLLTGSVGCGKTRLLYAIGKHLSPLYPPNEVVVDTLSRMLSIIHDNSEGRDWLMYAREKYCNRTKILFIDEFDKRKMSKSDYEIINQIIIERYGNKLQTVVVGNGDLQKAKDNLGEAVVSRLIGRADRGRYFHQEGKDRRQ